MRYGWPDRLHFEMVKLSPLPTYYQEPQEMDFEVSHFD
jgi:hypothetical protein